MLDSPRAFFVMGATLLASAFVPVAKAELPKDQPVEAKTQEDTVSVLATSFFGDETPQVISDAVVETKMQFVSTRSAYPAALKVIQKHEDTIVAAAEKYGVPEDVAIGVGLLENGGSETAKSRSGAMGIFQLMPGTARSLGLTVNKKVDERKNPAKNIDAGLRYLSANYQRFGDWGLATWAYHAGEGNVTKAVQLFAKEQDKVVLTGLKDAAQMKQYIQDHDATIHEVLASPAVKKFTKKLNDDTAGYPYKVLATAELFKKAK